MSAGMPPPTSPYHAALGGGMGVPPGPPPIAMPSPSGAPPPTGIGAMSTGGGTASPRTAASAAIMALREYKNQFPASAQQIDGFIESIKRNSGSAGMKPGTAPDGNAGLDIASMLGAPTPGGPPPPPPPGAMPGM